jgi:pyruvate dehydrogenase E1 component
LRKHFEVSAEAIVGATLSKLAREGKFKTKDAQRAMDELGLNIEAVDPARF